MTLPVHLICGFLGAGKTTLLNGLLRAPRMARSGVLVNELGTTGIDHDLVVGGSDDMLLLDGGCLCCQPRGSVADGIMQLLKAAEQPPARLLIETSGAANPVPILEMLATTPVLREHVHLASIVTVIDATTAVETLNQHTEARVQAACADHLAVSKLDLVRAGGSHARVGPALTTLNASAPRYLLRGEEPPPRLLAAMAGEETPAPGPSLRPLPQPETAHQQRFETVALEFDGELDATSVQDWIGNVLDAYGHNLLRIKGLLRLSGSSQPAVLQCVRDVVHPISYTERPPAGTDNRIVAIGWDIHPDLLRDALRDLAARTGDGVN